MEYIRTAEREFEAGERLTLSVEGRSGNISIEGQDTDRVSVQVVAHIMEDSAQAADTVLEEVMEGIRQSGDRLVIVTPQVSNAGPWFLFGRGTRVDYTITVPRATVCQVSSRSGRVEIARVAGPIDIEARSGRTTVREVDADVRIAGRSGSIEVEEVGGGLAISGHSGRVVVRGVRGDARVGSHSGAIDVERVGGSAELTCHSGAIQVDRVAGDLKAVAQSGRVVANDIGGTVELHVRSGSAVLSRAAGPVRIRSATGSVVFRGAVLGDLDIQSTAGGVRLEVDTDRPFFLDAESTSGSIRSEITPRRDAAPPPEDAPRARIRTTSGGIRLSRYVA
jgi:DUF4097 and DUF4098 domain-containing protein YvlB